MSMSELDARKVISNWGVLTTEVAPRVAPILLLIRSAAATDPDMQALQDEVEDARLTRVEHNARVLFERGDFRHGITLDHARDVLWAYCAPELFELLVVRRSWALDDYGRFIAQGMIAALLPATS